MTLVTAAVEKCAVDEQAPAPIDQRRMQADMLADFVTIFVDTVITASTQRLQAIESQPAERAVDPDEAAVRGQADHPLLYKFRDGIFL